MYGLAAPARGELPVLAPGIIVSNGTAALDVGDYAGPACADWNNDGRLDLVIGEYSGYLNIFTNRGTTTAHAFNGSWIAQYTNSTYILLPGR